MAARRAVRPAPFVFSPAPSRTWLSSWSRASAMLASAASLTSAARRVVSSPFVESWAAPATSSRVGASARPRTASPTSAYWPSLLAGHLPCGGGAPARWTCSCTKLGCSSAASSRSLSTKQ